MADRRQTHIDFCIGCKEINEMRKNENDWVMCYEHAARNIDAMQRLIPLYNYKDDAPNHNLPVVQGTMKMNLLSVVNDIARRFPKGTLVAGETTEHG